MAAETQSAPAEAPVAPPRPHPVARVLGGHVLPLMKYLMRTEVHTYAFSVAANAILSFFPFVLLMLVLTRKVLHSRLMHQIILDLLRDYLPVSQDFLIRNLTVLAQARNRAAFASLAILLVTSTGVFLPLEVALNQVWGFRPNRPYWKNQLVSLGLALASGTLAMLSVALSAGNRLLLDRAMRGHLPLTTEIVAFMFMKLFAVMATIAIFFLIYWLLPNGKVRAATVLPAAIFVGLLWELAKYVYILLLPWLNFQEVYGPFSVSVTLIIWAFLSGLLLLAGAYLSAGPEKS